MARREAVVATALEMEQLVEGIAVRQPGRAFLVGAEQLAVAVPLQRHDITQAAVELFHLAVGRYLQQAAATLVRRIAGLAGFHGFGCPHVAVRLLPVAVAGIRAPHGDIPGTVRPRGEPQRSVHAAVHDPGIVADLRIVPAFHDRLAGFGNPVAIGIAEAHDLFGQQGVRHAVLHHHAERVVVGDPGRKRIELVLDAVAIGVAQQVEAAVVATREQAAVGRVFDVVEVGGFHLQLVDAEAGHQHLDQRRVLGRLELDQVGIRRAEEAGVFRGQPCLDLRDLAVVELAVEEHDLRDPAAEEMAHGRLHEARAHRHAVHREGHVAALAPAVVLRIDPQPGFTGSAGHGEEMAAIGGQGFCQQVPLAALPGAFDVQDLGKLAAAGLAAEVEGQAAGEVVPLAPGAAEERREVARGSVGRCYDKHRTRPAFEPGNQQRREEIVARELRRAARPARAEGGRPLREMARVAGRVVPEVHRLTIREAIHVVGLPRLVLAGRIEPQREPVRDRNAVVRPARDLAARGEGQDEEEGRDRIHGDAYSSQTSNSVKPLRALP